MSEMSAESASEDPPAGPPERKTASAPAMFPHTEKCAATDGQPAGERPPGSALGGGSETDQGGVEPARDQPRPGDHDWRETVQPQPPCPPPVEVPAANDPLPGVVPGSELPVNLVNFAIRWGATTDAPIDQPDRASAELGKLTAVQALASRGNVPQALVDNIIAAKAYLPGAQAPGATVVPLAGRTGAYLLYAMAIEVGARVEKGKALDPDLLAIFGSWLVRRLLEPSWMPPGQTIARLRAALVRPDGQTAKGWREKGRQRALSNACHALAKAISANRVAAAAVGLGAPKESKPLATDAVSVFSRSFRRRVNNLKDFASKNNVGGASGYGTLSRHGLCHEGGRLLDRVHAGEAVASHICLQVLTHLPSDTMQEAIVINGGPPPDKAIAWFDVAARTFSYQLFHLVERGARPAPDAVACYEVTRQVVTIHLPPFLGDDLQARMERATSEVKIERDLLGPIDLHPQADIEARAGYKITVRRVQESIPTHLLQMGWHRWPVALATNSQFLLSRGRPAYSICPASRVADTVNAGYELLGWPRATASTEDVLIGSFVTPTAAAIAEMLNGLAARADRLVTTLPDRDALVGELNAVAAWLASVMALCLALRESVTYQVMQSELAAGLAAHLDDKHVHAVQGPPVPVVDFLRRAMLAWLDYGLDVAIRLHALGDDASVQLAQRIGARIKQAHSLEPVFSIGPDGQLQGVGTRSWRNVVPPTLLLQENFGRHFWPHQLMRAGVAQLAIDVVMRHQLDGLRPAGSNTPRSRAATRARLQQAMDAVLSEIGLRMPGAFSRG